MIDSREKGKRGEREAARCWTGTTGIPARRGQQYRGGPDSPDLILEDCDIHPEVKYVERLRLYPALEQAEHDAAGLDKVAVVLSRAKGKSWVLSMYLSNVMAFIEEMRLAKNRQAVRRMARPEREESGGL